ncbi:MAG: hypothetical protein IPJ65_31480 [Archangiaceae bacterium]|nr:hypothetical protein [Archangiaceae bacterium]
MPAAADGSHGSDEARIAEFRSRHDKAGAVPEVPLLERLLGVKPGASDVELDAEERARLEKTASPAALVLLELSDAQHGFDAKRAAPYLTALDKHLVRRDEEGVRVEGDAGATKGVAEVKLKDMQTGAWSFAEVRPDGGYSVGVDPSHFYALWFLPRGEPPFFAGTLELTYFKVTTPLTQWLRDDGALRRLLEK